MAKKMTGVVAQRDMDLLQEMMVKSTLFTKKMFLISHV
jgi:hypothetical protein